MFALARTLCYFVLFFSLAQPALLVPEAEEARLFFIVAGLATFTVLCLRFSRAIIPPKLPQTKYIFGMLGAYTLSEAQFFWMSGTLAVFLIWLKKIVLFWIVINVVQNWSDLRKSVWSVLGAVAVITWMGWDTFLNYPGSVPNDLRLQAVGNYNNPNSFALLLTCAFPLSFSMFEAERSTFKRSLLLLFMVSLVVSCIYTRSRGGSLGMLMAVMLSFLLSRRVCKSTGLKVFSALAAFGAFLIYGVGIILTRPDANSFLGSGGEASAGDRLMAWVAALRMFTAHPIFGVGWGKFVENALAHGMDKKLLAHNTLLSVLAETGLVGFTCFVAIIILPLRQLWQMRKHWVTMENKVGELTLSNGVLISFVCFLINTSFSVKDHDPVFWALLALAGVLFKLYRLDSDTEFTRHGH